MLDPVTALGAATAAFNGIKSMINTGREISDMGSQLGKWATSLSDLDFEHEQAKNPPFFKKIISSNIEQQALEAWAHKKKAEEMREELRNYISWHYGPSAWDEIVRIESKMRKQRRELEYAAIERKENIINLAVGVACFIIGTFLLVGVIYLIGVNNGRF